MPNHYMLVIHARPSYGYTWGDHKYHLEVDGAEVANGCAIAW